MKIRCPHCKERPIWTCRAIEGERECGLCGHRVQIKRRKSAKRDDLEALLQSLAKGQQS